MKILYVSDLDGTLLNRKQELNEDTAKQINELIKSGVNFTIATGRGDSARKILSEIDFKLPVIVLNGAVSYDFNKNEYVNSKAISRETVMKIMQIINNLRIYKI